MDNKIQEIKNHVERPATEFLTGGFRPQNTLEESWIGRVFAYAESEEIPLDKEGKQMMPLIQLYLPNQPFVPEQIKDKKLITVFISHDFPDALEKMGDHWIIREYENLEEIVIKDLKSSTSYLKPFPLSSKLFTKDAPIWDGGGLEDLEGEMEDKILELEEEGIINSYYDIMEHCYSTKLGGYPSYCQPGIGIKDGFGKGFEYVFQVSSDNKAQLNVVDSGSFMFAKNSETKEWSLYYDFY
ncbi:DUF1963 domain-containing protein [Chryseobacterium sp. Tr-659]|uniref:DUF1963 domain-containing protein n=1 Tax=Chryseobacterium sp. Tr-659 TaxID=2608340 RepID=UPI0014218E8B|nr:DUF1963 domain-containing protein [Chryseobacterium sp. Tr-659]NIF04386.1 DUF1963 domain-containing protein [Chryseobacterium sp. Tr-659]